MYKEEEVNEAFYGWLLPKDSGIKCSIYSHCHVAEFLNCREHDLEIKGWYKLTQGPSIPNTGTFFNKTYIVAFGVEMPTREQQRFFNNADFFFVDDTNGILRYAHKPK